ncbi:MAG: NYN domain-containing protein [Rhodoferax sp.]|nr:NYN domain-containing protein [Rhodoferax sp.]
MKTVWIVDAAYLYNFGKSRPSGFDYLKLKNELTRANGGPIDESYYLNSTSDPTAEAQNAFHTWLKSAPPKGPQMRVQLYRLKEMHLKCPACGTPFDRQVQKGVDVALATLMIRLAVQGACDRLILSAGDGDLEDAIRYLKSDLRRQVWLNGAQATLSADLQCYADRVLWLDDMAAAIDK